MCCLFFLILRVGRSFVVVVVVKNPREREADFGLDGSEEKNWGVRGAAAGLKTSN